MAPDPEAFVPFMLLSATGHKRALATQAEAYVEEMAIAGQRRSAPTDVSNLLRGGLPNVLDLQPSFAPLVE